MIDATLNATVFFESFPCMLVPLVKSLLSLVQSPLVSKRVQKLFIKLHKVLATEEDLQEIGMV